ncbi:MAG: hypothetical protein IGS39_22945 [Calothrix sp. C42_A2020_038]|nr:hypothetical protein [Calothrix sp. C42_A2020_038]
MVSGTFEAILAGTIQIKKFSASIEAPLPRVQIVHVLMDSNGNELEEVEGTLQTLVYYSTLALLCQWWDKNRNYCLSIEIVKINRTQYVIPITITD